MAPERKVELAVQMSMEARRRMLESIRLRHPQYDDEQTRFALFRQLVGDELFRHAWPSAPVLEL